MPERQRFATSMGASALLHLFILGSLFILAFAPKKPVSIPQLEVDLSSLPLPASRGAKPAPAAPQVPAQPAPAIAAPQQQIVEPSDAGEEKEPENTNLLSDRNNIVPEEMVKKGDGGNDANSTENRFTREEARQPAPAEPKAAEPAPQPPPPKPAPPKPPQAAQPPPRAAAPPRNVARAPAAPARRDPGDLAGERMASLPSLDRLLPKAEDLARQIPSSGDTQEPRSQRNGRDLLNSGGQVFSGKPGTRDFLPRVREGNITMLNTKADLFAPFVRRVAGRVFENLDMALGSLRAQSGSGSGRTQAWVEAVMDRKGRFVRAEIKEQQGLNSVSRLLLGSAQPDTFFDANPPAGAEANDGLIHFRLMIDLMVDSAVDPRTGRPYTSYYGVAGVGLL